MIELKEKEDQIPVCPHCGQMLNEMWYREMKSTWGKRYVYFCSMCKKVLGVSHRKGFFMG